MQLISTTEVPLIPSSPATPANMANSLPPASNASNEFAELLSSLGANFEPASSTPPQAASPLRSADKKAADGVKTETRKHKEPLPEEDDSLAENLPEEKAVSTPLLTVQSSSQEKAEPLPWNFNWSLPQSSAPAKQQGSASQADESVLDGSQTIAQTLSSVLPKAENAFHSQAIPNKDEEHPEHDSNSHYPNPAFYLPAVASSVIMQALGASDNRQVKSRNAQKIESLDLAVPSVEASGQSSTASPLAFEAKLTPLSSEAKTSASADPNSKSKLLAEEAGKTGSEQPNNPAHPQMPQTKQSEHESRTSDEQKQELVRDSISRTVPQRRVEPESKGANAPVTSPVVSTAATQLGDHRTKAHVTQQTSTAAEVQDLPTALPTEPARDISLRIGSSPSDAVDVKLVERGGKIHVDVRSADPVTTQSLQANVKELAGKLETAGFHSETTLPDRTQPARESQQNQSFQERQDDRRAPQQELQAKKKRAASNTATFQLISQENE